MPRKTKRGDMFGIAEAMEKNMREICTIILEEAKTVNAEEEGTVKFLNSEYYKEKYGLQGDVQEIKITDYIKVATGEEKTFENKVLTFEEYVIVRKDAKLKFRNCVLIVNTEDCIRAESDSSINFENCFIEFKNQFICYNNANIVSLEFYDCSIICTEEHGEQCFMALRGRVYFENCIIKTNYLCGYADEIEFKGCEFVKGIDHCMRSEESEEVNAFINAPILKFYKCHIANPNFFLGFLEGTELYMDNCYFDDISGKLG